MKQISIILLLSMSLSLKAQTTHFADRQIFGFFGSSVLNDFNSHQMQLFKNGNLANEYFAAGSSTICDSNGRLLLLCNGMKLFDSNGVLVQGGAQLVSDSFFNYEFGFNFYSQGSIILPMGGSLYYVVVINYTNAHLPYFYSSAAQIRGADELLLYKVDVSANGGLPKVIDTIALVQGGELNGVCMTATNHANGQAWWLVKSTRDSSGLFVNGLPVPKNRYVSFYLSKDSIGPAIYQEFPGTYLGSYTQSGQAMFNCQGNKFVCTNRSLNHIFIADFDRNTAVFSNPQFIKVPDTFTWNTNIPLEIDSGTHGVCFSPNSQFVYVNKWSNVYQYDLLDTNTATQWQHIYGIDTTWTYFQVYGGIYPGPDNRLYLGYWGGTIQNMSYIDSPSLKGTACKFMRKGLNPAPGSPTYCTVHCPPNLPYYDMDLVPCDTTISHGNGTIAVKDWQKNTLNLELYPNPTHDIIYIKVAGYYSQYRYELIGLDGKVIQAGTLSPSLSLKGKEPGLYLIRISKEKESAVRKLIIN